MDFQILSILPPEKAHSALQLLATHPFIDGKITASGMAKEVKNNRQADRNANGLDELDALIRSSLFANELFQAFAFPKRVRQPIFSRYEPGMNYGAHVDSTVIQDSGISMRADLAITLFLSPPDTYEGGELVIESSCSGEEEIKLAPGEAVVYSASSVHRVAPVTSGVRVAAVTWVQTAVRDSGMRKVLFDLYLALQQVGSKKDPTLLLSKVYNNLLRMTVEL